MMKVYQVMKNENKQNKLVSSFSHQKRKHHQEKGSVYNLIFVVPFTEDN
jgi:hypothetical protein